MMNNGNDKKGLIGLVVVLSVLVVGLSSYLIYDKLLEEDEVNNKDNEIEENDNNEINEMLDLNQLNTYKYTNGKYGEIKSTSWTGMTDSYSINLTIDGKVYIHNNNDGKEVRLNIENVVDIISFSKDFADGEGYCYMLTNSGDVYYYKILDAKTNNNDVTKVKELSSVKRIISIDWCSDGCAWDVFAVTTNDEYIKLGGGSI